MEAEISASEVEEGEEGEEGGWSLLSRGSSGMGELSTPSSLS